MPHNLDNLKHTFGMIAEQYDAARPGYPAAVIDTVLAPFEAGTPLHVLEIGCGSGQATRLFAERGHDIVATDLSADLVATAQQRLAAFPNVRFATGAFEELALSDSAFDLVISAQAFHWIDPAVGLPKAARLLKPHGRLALFWNFIQYDATPLLQAVRGACVSHMPAFAGWPDASVEQFNAFANYWRGLLQDSSNFTDVAQTVHASSLNYTPEQFQHLIRTFSWFQTQPLHTRTALLQEIAILLPQSAKMLVLPVRTLLLTATQ